MMKRLYLIAKFCFVKKREKKNLQSSVS